MRKSILCCLLAVLVTGCGSKEKAEQLEKESKAKEAEVRKAYEETVLAKKKEVLVALVKEMVEKKLKAPASAVWDLHASNCYDGKTMDVLGHVDSPNEYGVMLRTSVAMIFEYNYEDDATPKPLLQTFGDDTIYFDRARLEELENLRK